MIIEIGTRFTRLVAVSETRKVMPNGRLLSAWLMVCDCGKEKVCASQNLKGGRQKSCGCLRAEKSSDTKTIHGAQKTGQRWPEYSIWSAMKRRCLNPKSKFFRYYGGRGITVCDRWAFGANGLTGFQCFVNDMGRRPSPELSIDRIEVNGNYEPGNCRWATKKEQHDNRRPFVQTKCVHTAETKARMSARMRDIWATRKSHGSLP